MSPRDRVDPVYRHVLLPPVRALTRRDAEVAMDLHLASLRLLQRTAAGRALLSRGRPAVDPRADALLGQDLLDGVHFPHPFGIAAGLDKNAAVVPALVAHHSPGFVEIGTVTREPQPGNPRPRITRRDADHLVNAMGFPSAGARAVAANLAAVLGGPLAPPVPVGVNVGKNKTTPPEGVAAEYAAVVRAFADRGAMPAYVAVNVSSPNTPGLRALQDKAVLTDLLAAVAEAMAAAPDPRPRHRLLVKFAPDLTPSAFESLVECVLEQDIGGLILTNTRPVQPKGGLSGPDLFADSSALVRRAAAALPADKVIVATGGMDTVDKVYEMLRYADLVGVYTGLVLQGPGLLRHLRDGVAARMRADGVTSLAQLRSAERVRA